MKDLAQSRKAVYNPKSSRGGSKSKQGGGAKANANSAASANPSSKVNFSKMSNAKPKDKTKQAKGYKTRFSHRTPQPDKENFSTNNNYVALDNLNSETENDLDEYERFLLNEKRGVSKGVRVPKNDELVLVDSESEVEEPQKVTATGNSGNAMADQEDYIGFDFSSSEDETANDRYNEGEDEYNSEAYLSNDEGSALPNAQRPRVNDLYPWVKNHDHSAEQEISDWLTMEIMDFIAYISPSAAEIKSRNDAVRRLRDAITGLWPDCEVQVFGSYATDLYLPGSDIDMVITSASGMQFDNRQCLFQLSSFLRNQRLGVQVEPIAKAKVPIIKFVEPISNIHIDVSFERTNGLTAATQIRKWLDTTPGLRELVLVVKQFLSSRKLNNVHVGGLGGYSTICLVYAYLRLHPRLSTQHIDPLQNLGCLLIEFFELYGNNFGYDNLIVAVDDMQGPRYLNRRYHPDLAAGRNPFSLVIQDPSDPSNNISRGSFNLRDLKKSFTGAYELLCSRCYELKGASYKERLGQSILGNVIKYRGTQRDFNDDRHIVVNEAIDNQAPEKKSIVTGKKFSRKMTQQEEIYFSDMTISSDEGKYASDSD